jgi:hypothetical protein
VFKEGGKMWARNNRARQQMCPGKIMKSLRYSEGKRELVIREAYLVPDL